MVDTMIKEDDKKGKKGVAIIIAVGGKPPNPPTKTLDSDEKKKAGYAFSKAWAFLKNEPTHCPIHGDELQMIGDPALDDEIGPSWCPTCAELPKNEMGEQEASVLGER